MSTANAGADRRLVPAGPVPRSSTGDELLALDQLRGRVERVDLDRRAGPRPGRVGRRPTPAAFASVERAASFRSVINSGQAIHADW